MLSFRVLPRLSHGVALSLAALVLVPTVAWRSPVPTASLTKGLTFKLVMTLRPAAVGRTVQQPSLLRGTGMFANGRGRIDIDSSSGPVAFSKGDYLVVDSGHTLLIRPSVQTYSEIDSPIHNPLRQMAAQLTSPVVLSGVKVEMAKLGTTDSVGGRTTQHYRITAEYDVDLGTRTVNSQITTDLWITKLPFHFANPVEASMRPARMPKDFDKVFDKIAAYSTQLANEGTTIKSITTTTIATGTTSWDVVQSAELRDIREADVDESTFRIPERFRKGGGL